MISVLWVNRSCEIDEIITSAWKTCTDTPGYAVVGMGSYARREMAPFSDVDLLLLRSDDDARDEDTIAATVRKLQSTDSKMSIISRSVRDSSGLFELDTRSWFALVESRFVCGDREVYDQLHRMIRADAIRVGETAIMQRLESYATDRRRQYGDTVRLLEPNIKNSAGSLRDIHSLYYFALVHALLSGDGSGSGMFPDVIPFSGLQAQRLEALTEAWGFFLTVRETLHDTVGHLHDTLEYDLQRIVAERLGYGHADTKESVESFMREYYGHAKSVSWCFGAVFRSRAVDHDARETIVEISGDFLLRGTSLHLHDAVGRLDDVSTVSAFVFYSQRDIEFGRDVIEAIDACASDAGIEFGAEARTMFDSILRESGRVGATLRRMNELGVLERIVPHFTRLVSWFQHNIYHYYTADEHTLRAVEKCEALANDPGYIGDVFRALPDRSVAYYAVLFHDIAKPIDLGRHENVGADIALRALPSFGRADIEDDVAFAVRHHLLTEKVGFRRNFHEKTTLRQYCDVIGTLERLDLLLVLAYADMSALNPGVWTNWKGAILCELHALASAYIRNGDIRAALDESGASQAQGGADSDDRPTESNRNVIVADEHVDGETMAAGVLEGRLAVVAFRSLGSLSEVVIATRDAPSLLSNMAAVLLASDASVVDANIETRRDGIAIDVFRLTDIITGGALRAEQMDRVRALLDGVLSHEVDTDVLYERHRKKWRRKIRRGSNPAIKTEVRFHDHVTDAGSLQTIVEVFAPDTFGLLYKLAQVISSFQFTILHAKIATRVDGVVDSFYVTDATGSSIHDPVVLDALSRALLAQIHALVHPESTHQ